jgi:hypothetical protein
MSEREAKRLCRFLENPADTECREFRASLRLFLESDTEGAAWLREARQVGLSGPKSPLLAWWFRSEARFVPLAMAALVGVYLACFLSSGLTVSGSDGNTTPSRTGFVSRDSAYQP